jgi:IS5 family transposase
LARIITVVNDLVVQAAVKLGLEDGTRLRVDTTVVETDIHHPTDNTLLWDVVRVLTRLVGRLAKALKLRRIKGFRDRRRAAHRRMYEIQRMTTRQRQGAGSPQRATYRVLIDMAEEVVANARTALDKTATMRGTDVLTALKIDAIRDEIMHYCGLGERVIDQARRRILDGEQVPTPEKLYSIFEPHTDLIKRGKVRTPVEFGHKVFLAESAKGLITQYEVLEGNPADEAPSLKRHRRTFRRAPELYGADRGFSSEQNVAICVRGAVATVCIPQRGGHKTPQRQAYERSPAFKQGQRFRAGIEGRISVLFRGRGMKRCRADGAERFSLFVGAAVLANNLMIIAALLIKRSRRRRKAER